MAATATPAKICIELSPPLYEKQRQAIYHESRYVFIEASTKCGKTMGCLYWIIEQACQFSNGANLWWVAPVYKQTLIAYNRLKRGLLPYKDLGFKFSDTNLQIIFPNGAIISCKSGDDPDNLYGEDVVRVIIDEASRVKEESWHAIRSTLTATRGLVRCIGNVKGRTNWFYRLSRKAQEGADDMAYFVMDVYDAVAAGVVDVAEIKDAKATLPEAVFNELYLCIVSDDGGNPFGIKAIQDCIRPMSERNPVIYGLDLAKKKDYAVLIGLDDNGYVCRYHRWQSSWEQTITFVSEATKGIPIVADSTGVGDPVVERLILLGSNVIPHLYTSKSKQQLMEGLAVAIQSNIIGFPNNEIVKELEIFEYEYTRNSVKYSAPEGFHDDTVNALALANSGLVRLGTSGGSNPPECSGILRETSFDYGLDSSDNFEDDELYKLACGREWTV